MWGRFGDKTKQVRRSFVQMDPAQQHHHIYLGWDVHAYTPQMRAQARSDAPQMYQPIARDVVLAAVVSMVACFRARHPATMCEMILDKMLNRCNSVVPGCDTPQYLDADLDNLNVGRLLVGLWELACKLNNDACYDALEEQLTDTGMTCIQGDSHRLLSLYLALGRSYGDEAAMKANATARF